MKRIIGILAVALALIVGNLTLTSATASSSHSNDHRTTLHLTSVTVDIADLDFNETGPSVGDQVVFTDNLFQNGKRVGEDHGQCAIARITGTGASGSITVECHVTLVLAAGQITIQGVATFTGEGPQTNVLAVTGGTGAYQTAHGQIRARDVSETRTELTIQLILND
jgi:hypothetical protein